MLVARSSPCLAVCTHLRRGAVTACQPSCTGHWAATQGRCAARGRRIVVLAGTDGGGGGGGDDAASCPDALPTIGIDSDWRAFRAALVASSTTSTTSTDSSAEPTVAAAAESAGGSPALSSGAAWAHSLPQPEQGCLLLANPLMFANSQQYFHMSVILVFTHGAQGSTGLILNRPTQYTVGELGAGAAGLQPELGPCRLFLGGDVGGESVHLLHGVRGLAGSVEVIPGVQLGGFEAAKAGLAAGRYTADQFQVLTRYAGWGPGQLEDECRRGVWLPVAACAGAVLQQLELPQQQRVAGWEQPTAAAAEGEGGAAAAGRCSMWHAIAQLAGGDLALLSREVRGVADPLIAAAAASAGASQRDLQQQQEQEQGQQATASASPEAEAEPGRGDEQPQVTEQGDQQSRGPGRASGGWHDGAGI